MLYDRPTLKDWLPLAIVSFVIFSISWTYSFTVGEGIAVILGIGAAVNALHQIGWAFVDTLKEARPDTFKTSQNYMAELIKSMNPNQLKAWGRVGNARVSVMARKGKNSQPVYMLHGEDISLDFLNHFLNLSTEMRVCPVSNFMAETHHWDWSQDNLVSDYEQACACRAYLVRNGWAEWSGNGTAPTWTMAQDGMRWTPEDIKRIHGLVEETEGNQ